jgi:hypothetical protein
MGEALHPKPLVVVFWE